MWRRKEKVTIVLPKSLYWPVRNYLDENKINKNYYSEYISIDSLMCIGITVKLKVWELEEKLRSNINARMTTVGNTIIMAEEES